MCPRSLLRIAGKTLTGLSLVTISLFALGTVSHSQTHHPDSAHKPSPPSGESSKKLEKATFGAGCFWCTEAVFQRLKGVHSVVSGYSGGHVRNPTYKQVCSGTTGHAEVVQFSYDPGQLSYSELLEVFWKTHDPTTPKPSGT
jgi:hypothetical protein